MQRIISNRGAVNRPPRPATPHYIGGVNETLNALVEAATHQVDTERVTVAAAGAGDDVAVVGAGVADLVRADQAVAAEALGDGLVGLSVDDVAELARRLA